MSRNANINPSYNFFVPSDELNDRLNRFDNTISDAFGTEVAEIEHALWSERVSFSRVRFTNGDYIGFRIGVNGLVDDTYHASHKHLRRAFIALGIELPHWLCC